jgi:hypothetical protein
MSRIQVIMKLSKSKILLISVLTLSILQMGCASAEVSPGSDAGNAANIGRKVASEMTESCTTTAVAPLLDKLFSSLGHDCEAYSALFATHARYYHQHDGFKNQADLLKNCQSYAEFCKGDACRFLQNGEPSVVSRGNSCQILVPYLWSEIPANKNAKGNLEPHTGWEYIVASPNSQSQFGYSIDLFAEHETTYSVAFDWATPDQTPALVADSTLHLLSLTTSDSKHACDSPIAPVLTKYFTDKSSDKSSDRSNDKISGANTWRQQGDAVVLAAGNVCHVSVPYSAQVGTKLRSGQFVFTLQPTTNNSYSFTDADVVEFPRVER